MLYTFSISRIGRYWYNKKIFQYCPILEHSNTWDLKAFFSGIRLTYYIILAPKFSYPANLKHFCTTLITCVFHTLALQQYQTVCPSKSIFRYSSAIQKYMDYWRKSTNETRPLYGYRMMMCRQLLYLRIWHNQSARSAHTIVTARFTVP